MTTTAQTKKIDHEADDIDELDEVEESSAPEKESKRALKKGVSLTSVATSRARQAASGAWGRARRNTSVAAEAAVVRLLVLSADFTLVLMTAMAFIPTLGAYLHGQSGASAGQLTLDGMIAIWVMPFVFVVAVVTVAEIAVMRWLWRLGSRRIEKVRRTRLGEFDLDLTTESTPETTTASESETKPTGQQGRSKNASRKRKRK